MRRTQTYKYRALVSNGAISKKRRFKAVIITKSALLSAACIISAVIFIFTALAVFKDLTFPKSDTILKVGMADAVPFLAFKKENIKGEYLKILKVLSGIDFKNQLSLVAYASPMFSDDINTNEENAEPQPQTPENPKINE